MFMDEFPPTIDIMKLHTARCDYLFTLDIRIETDFALVYHYETLLFVILPDMN